MQGQFWRNRAYYYRDRAIFWRGVSQVLAGVLAGITTFFVIIYLV